MSTVYNSETEHKLSIIKAKAARMGFDARFTTSLDGGRGNGVVLFPNEPATQSLSCVAFCSAEQALAWFNK